jgi:hypothetical protein
MSAAIRQAGNEWLVEVHGEPIGRASTEAEAQVLADEWTAKLKWVASWRFGQQPVASAAEADSETSALG